MMPSVSLGTCCGSDPTVGIPAWFANGGVGIDTAEDYRDQVRMILLLMFLRYLSDGSTTATFIDTQSPTLLALGHILLEHIL